MQGNLYVLVSLFQPEGDDALALLRYTLQGVRQSVELFGQNDPYQAVGFALHLRSDNTLYIVVHVREPLLAGADAETLSGSFGFVAEAFPVSESNIIVLLGTGDEAQTRMYGPDDVGAYALSLRTAYGVDNTLYAYIWAQEGDGSAALIRLEPATQTRVWTHTFPHLALHTWAVDMEGGAYLLGRDTEGFALWRFEPDGTPHRLSFTPPRQEQFWFHDSFLLLPLGRGLWLIGSSAYCDDPIYEQREPFHSVFGLYAVRGDTNNDGCVDDADLLGVLFSFGSDDSAADVSGDGVVDEADLLEVLLHYGLGC
ncbi:MAG: hypothetical protein ACK4P5_02495 [Fimbriimonadales bacterium]